jgi:hypothetical protein
MAKRKRIPGSGPKLHPIKEYRDDVYVPYIMSAETGILQAWTMDPDLRDGDVREVLRGLISPMKKSGELPEGLSQETKAADPAEEIEVKGRGNPLIQHFILMNLRDAFEKYGPLNVEDTVGILTVINNSVGAWNRGMRGQEYLKYIKDFLGRGGVQVWQLSDEEVENLELYRPEE